MAKWSKQAAATTSSHNIWRVTDIHEQDQIATFKHLKSELSSDKQTIYLRVRVNTIIQIFQKQQIIK